MKRAILLSLIGLAIGFGASFLITPRYSSTAELMLVPRAPQPISLTAQYLRLEGGINRIVADLDPHDSVVKAIGKHALKITPTSRPGIDSKDILVFRIRFDYPDARTAQALVTEIIDRLRLENMLMQRADTRRSGIADLEVRVATLEAKLGGSPTSAQSQHRVVPAFDIGVLEPPSYPAEPASPNRTIFATIGFAFGLTLAAFMSVRSLPA